MEKAKTSSSSQQGDKTLFFTELTQDEVTTLLRGNADATNAYAELLRSIAIHSTFEGQNICVTGADLAVHMGLSLNTLRQRVKRAIAIDFLTRGLTPDGRKAIMVVREQLAAHKSRITATTAVTARIQDDGRAKLPRTLMHGMGVKRIPENITADTAQLISPRHQLDFRQMVVPDGQRRTTATFSMRIGNRPYHVEAKAAARSFVMDERDLCVLYAMITLTYRYHTAYGNHYANTGTRPENRTPIYIRDVLTFLGLSDNGENRAKVRGSVDRVRSTVYDLHSIQAMFETGDTAEQLRETYATREFRFFDDFWKLAQAAAVHSETDPEGGFTTSESIYVVRWKESFFRLMLEDRFFWAYPKEAMTAGSWIFMLYLTFRSSMVRVTDRYWDGDELFNAFYVNSPFDNEEQREEALKQWHSRGAAALRRIVSHSTDFGLDASVEQDPDRPGVSWISVDLWGYKVDAWIRRAKIISLNAACDASRVLVYCGLSVDKGKVGAPLLVNEITPLLRQAEGLAEVNNLRVLTHQLTEAGVRTTENDHVAHVTLGRHGFTISRYTSDAELGFFARQMIMGMTVSLPEVSLLSHLRAVRDRRKSLVLDGVEINATLLDEVARELTNVCKAIITPADIVAAVHSRDGMLHQLTTESPNDWARLHYKAFLASSRGQKV